ncbi:MAG: hypothetical protein WC825_01160 [Gallionellaceae bacterium]|jgi:hypothetical protein
MQKCEKKGAIFIAIGILFFCASFYFFVTATGIILMAMAIAITGYGAGSVMDSPCGMVKK